MILGILGSILPGFLLPAFKAWLENRNNIEVTKRETALATIAERQEARRHSAETVQAAMHHRPFWIGWLMFVLPLGLWWNAVLLDSVFLFSGNIPDLPPSVRPWADMIIENIFMPGAVVAGATVLGKAIQKR